MAGPTFGYAPLAAQVDNICLHSTGDLDIYANIHTREGVEAAMREDAYKAKRGQRWLRTSNTRSSPSMSFPSRTNRPPPQCCR